MLAADIFTLLQTGPRGRGIMQTLFRHLDTVPSWNSTIFTPAWKTLLPPNEHNSSRHPCPQTRLYTYTTQDKKDSPKMTIPQEGTSQRKLPPKNTTPDKNNFPTNPNPRRQIQIPDKPKSNTNRIPNRHQCGESFIQANFHQKLCVFKSTKRAKLALLEIKASTYF